MGVAWWNWLVGDPWSKVADPSVTTYLLDGYHSLTSKQKNSIGIIWLPIKIWCDFYRQFHKTTLPLLAHKTWADLLFFIVILETQACMWNIYPTNTRDEDMTDLIFSFSQTLLGLCCALSVDTYALPYYFYKLSVLAIRRTTLFSFVSFYWFQPGVCPTTTFFIQLTLKYPGLKKALDCTQKSLDGWIIKCLTCLIHNLRVDWYLRIHSFKIDRTWFIHPNINYPNICTCFFIKLSLSPIRPRRRCQLSSLLRQPSSGHNITLIEGNWRMNT